MIMLMDRLARAPAQPRPRSANQEAQRITGRPYLSHSQLALMRACPRKFAFQYVEKAPPDFVASSLLLGSGIHEALELHFRARLEGLGTTPAALFSAYADSWRRQENRAEVPVRFNQKEDRQKLDALAQRMIDAFLASPISQPRGTILGVEEELRIVLDPQLPDVLAKVDLVTQTDDGLHVIDFKTSRSRWTEAKAAEASDQLVLYGISVSRMSQHLDLPVKLHFGVLTKAKHPLVQILPVPVDEQRMTTLREGVSQVWEAIKVGNFYPAPSPINCSICAFRSRCPVFAGR